MASSRTELQSKLEELMGNRNVYYQPPENLKINYPAIVYSKSQIEKIAADDTAYLLTNRYSIQVISKRPDHPVVEKLLALPMCSADRPVYVADGLYHETLTLYY